MTRQALVVTTVASPTPVLEALATAAQRHRVPFVCVGDVSSPEGFALPGCEYYDIARQRELPFELARVCPTRHYARKNIGYLVAMAAGASVILETDDDSVVDDAFWRLQPRTHHGRTITVRGWFNAYRLFTRGDIWPRGFPLDAAMARPMPEAVVDGTGDCPIQQALIDGDPDVDAVYRMLFALPFRFERRPSVALGAGAWCPFNSQNTTWWRDAFPLMYLPATCAFRLTDIWRSFVAQRIAWANGWSVLFRAPTLRQQRNPHDLTQDFAQEVGGYLENRAICDALEALEIEPGVECLAANLRRAYELMVERGWLAEPELLLLDAWLADVTAVLGPVAAGAGA